MFFFLIFAAVPVTVSNKISQEEMHIEFHLLVLLHTQVASSNDR